MDLQIVTANWSIYRSEFYTVSNLDIRASQSWNAINTTNKTWWPYLVEVLNNLIFALPCALCGLIMSVCMDLLPFDLYEQDTQDIELQKLIYENMWIFIN